MAVSRDSADVGCVLCVGQSTLDHVLFVPTSITAGHKHVADRFQVVGGGVATNAAVAVSRSGGSSILASCVGNDPAGRAVLDGLADEGVDTHFVTRVASTPTPFSTIVVSADGTRTVFNHTPADLFDRPCPPLDRRPINAVLTDCRWPAGTQAALRHAHTHGVPSVVDVDRRITDPETRRVVLELGTHLVFSEDALRDTTGCASSADGLRALARQTRAHVSVALGELAGFHFAAAAAALKCSRPGARAGMPDRPAVDELVGRPLTVIP